MDTTTKIWTYDQTINATIKKWTPKIKIRYFFGKISLSKRMKNPSYNQVMDVKDQDMDVTTKIWTLRPRYGRFNQDMDITTKIWTLRPRYGHYDQDMDVTN